MKSKEDSWERFLQVMEDALGKPTFETCLKFSILKKINNGKAVIQVSSAFAKERLETKYVGIMKDTLQKIYDSPGLDLALEVDENLLPTRPDLPEQMEFYKQEQDDIPENSLDPRYTLESFVVGNSNQFATGAALAVSRSPGKVYNPLLIFGGVGLGKTHLMQAIGNNVLARKKKARVVYLSTERFINEMIDAMAKKKIEKFRKKYRTVDVLLVDDIQFLVNKEFTQEEFFHTFNELYGANKQIVMTCDRLPRELFIDKRLSSRFEWGLTADIQEPDLETREAILRKKAEQKGISLPNSVIHYIAERVPSNVRELEGALLRVLAFGTFRRQPVNTELAQEALKGIIPEGREQIPTVEKIIEKVASYFDIKTEEIMSDRRDRRFAYPRQIAMFLSREITNLSYPDLAKKFRRDHTTVLHAYEKISTNLHDISVRNSVDNIRSALKVS
ncbi:MAG: chromosomal replication initiator protein DnaA [Chloroflexi bacterium]|nr:chromosomal replication initiator protein DnaA [Chloroflexota bacterium]